jgi:hypothetical protein
MKEDELELLKMIEDIFGIFLKPMAFYSAIVVNFSKRSHQNSHLNYSKAQNSNNQN